MNWLRLRIPPLVVTGLAVALIWAIALAVPSLAVEMPLRLLTAAALALLGCGVALWAVVSFRRAKTTVNPLNPEATSQLLVHGIYGRSRNPMYVGMLFALAGWCAYHGNIAAALVLPGFVWYLNRFQIQPEEEMLTRKFGPPFEAYLLSPRTPLALASEQVVDDLSYPRVLVSN